MRAFHRDVKRENNILRGLQTIMQQGLALNVRSGPRDSILAKNDGDRTVRRFFRLLREVSGPLRWEREPWAVKGTVSDGRLCAE